MTKLCFTASRDLEVVHLVRLYGLLEPLLDPEYDEYWTGGAPGGDQAIARFFIARRPDAHHGIVLPDLRSSTYSHHKFATQLRRGVDAGRLTPSIELVFTGLHPMARNPLILDRGDELYGYPRHPEASASRSGTWSTIQLARRRQMRHTVTVLEG